MKQLIAFLIFISVANNYLVGQELFPLHEPASNIPKGVFGIRATSEHTVELDQFRNQFTGKLMYGILKNWEIEAQAEYSNHHGNALPVNLINHTHNGSLTNYYATQKVYGIPYPYIFSGFYFYSKYRFLSLDDEGSHLRASLFAEYSTTNVAHDEAEPNLEGDTGGEGGGLVVTYLYQKFAISLTSGVIIPETYHDIKYDKTHSPGVFYTNLSYGKAIHYDLSLGYLLYPKTYGSYSDLNINVYAEFEGKSYDSAIIHQNGGPVEAKTSTLKKGNYIDFYPSIQFIFNSNTRIDATMGFSLYNKSYTHFYPMVLLGVQRYIFMHAPISKPKTPKTL